MEEFDPTPENIMALYRALGRPSARKFALELRERGMRVTDADVQRAIVGLQSTRQVLAPPPRYDGKIFSLGIDYKWFSDVMTLPSGSSVGHFLMVQDVFSRFLWARPMANQGAVLEPMRDIMRVRKPQLLYTDADAAFTSNAFRAAMRELGVDARIRTGRNDIATLDSAIKLVKEAIVRERGDSGEPDWAKHVNLAVRAFNNNRLDYLMMNKPKDVKPDTDLEALLERENLQYLQHNLGRLARRTNRLTDKGFFRAYVAPERTKGWRRVGDNRYSAEIHKVERIERNMVVDEQGRRFPIKEVLPIEGASTELKLVGRGISLASQAKRTALEPEREALENVLEELGGQGTIRVVNARLPATFMPRLLAEGVSRNRPFDAFVALFPELFEFYGRGPTRGLKLKS